MDLTQPLIRDDLKSSTFGEHVGGLITPQQVAGIQARGPIGGEYLCCPGRLGIADFIERNVGLTLEAVDHVPLSPTVAPNDDSGSCHRRSSTLSSISGQSRHSLSSA